LTLSQLAEQVRQNRVTQQTWLYQQSADTWTRAGELPELKSLFPTGGRDQGSSAGQTDAASGISTQSLRRIKLFAGLEESQLAAFIHYLEKVNCPQFSHLVRQGQRGDAMYLVVQGELRALSIVEGKETTLTTLVTGDWFGEISLLDHGARSVDVIANRDSQLLKLSSGAFERLLRDAPELAVPFLLALSRTVAERIRRATKRYEDSVRFIRTGGIVH
jgi:signal-transduction protein with cAMP-binding, CBS, and nucleotidyltransferase domain